MELLQVENLTFSYPESGRAALKDVSFSLAEGGFTIVCGPSGCGKSTLLKLLKKEIAPYGEIHGTRRYQGVSYEDLEARVSGSQIGYLAQDPDSQIVMDTVWQELAFGAENLGMKQEEIRSRVAEMAAYFGIESWFHKKTEQLSGGQKQLLNLASVMTLEPRVLLLDEPTAQLDPIAAGDFFAMIGRLHRELGVTVLIAEHRLEEILPMADRVLFLDGGEMRYDGSADGIGTFLRSVSEGMAAGLPAAVRLYGLLGETGPTPLSVVEGRQMIKRYANTIRDIEAALYETGKNPAAEIRGGWFRYGRNGQDVLRDAALTIYEGEHYCLFGGNGSGKTTLLSVICGVRRLYAGSVKLFGKPLKAFRDGERNRGVTAMLPQDPKEVFVCDTVREDWELACKTMGINGKERDEAVAAMAARLGTEELLTRHPYDLSGGEQQKAALGKVLLLNPKLLLLDEPTKGLDAAYKAELYRILKAVQAAGTTILTVTHDAEFAAECADRAGLFFDGAVAVSGPVRDVFSANAFYTTAACRIARGYYGNPITVSEIAELCLKNGRVTS
ncbi:MAG: ATP-binding cassette domain-containing protein [Lachnospiraceae bacterium]|nr:ATP-binding cassette domain-containing protein [Lachnospiraceae bacterium]